MVAGKRKNPKNVKSSPYDSNWDYLLAECRLLDGRLLREIERFRELRKAEWAVLRGLVIPDEEIDQLLPMNAGSPPEVVSNHELAEKQEEHLAEFERLHRQRVEATISAGILWPLLQIQRIFGLGPLEQAILFVALAPEFDLKYERIFAYLQDNVTHTRPSVELILQLLCGNAQERLMARQFFSSQSALVKNHLVTLRPRSQESTLLAHLVRVEDRIGDYVLGQNQVDTRILPYTTLYSTSVQPVRPAIKRTSQHLHTVCRNHLKNDGAKARLVFLFHGPRGVGKKTAARTLTQALRAPVLIVDVAPLLESGNLDDEILLLLFREAVLLPCAIYLDNFHLLLSEDPKNQWRLSNLLRHLQQFSWLTFLGSERNWVPQDISARFVFIPVHFPLQNELEREQVWRMVLDGHLAESNGFALNGLATKFCFTTGQIFETVQLARSLAKLRHPQQVEVTGNDLYEACRQKSTGNLGDMARKVEPVHTWEDLILPKPELLQLREICAQVRQRYRVLEEWGFGRKVHHFGGLSALFSGFAGTGKTMAAEIIAGDLGLDLYKIDLAGVVSKYIGETEKNLRQVFAAAESSNAILFFDEADALFGKRSEVRDAHDRYANIEIGYLLQRMEEYEGITILATNLKKNIDEAFLRRLHFLVEFPFPNAVSRRKIWKNHLPSEAPRDRDLDFDFLANQFNVSGGNIRNIVVNAAFLAAEDGGRIGMPHIIRATRREYEKIGKICIETEFEKYADLLKLESADEMTI